MAYGHIMLTRVEALVEDGVNVIQARLGGFFENVPHFDLHLASLRKIHRFHRMKGSVFIYGMDGFWHGFTPQLVPRMILSLNPFPRSRMARTLLTIV